MSDVHADPPHALERDEPLARLVATVERRLALARRADPGRGEPALGLEPPWRTATTPWMRPLLAWGAPTAAFAILAGLPAPGVSGIALLVLGASLAVVVVAAGSWSVVRAWRVRREGVALPVAVLRAHEELWEPGGEARPRPAQVLFSFDEGVRRRPRRLVELAEELRARAHASDPLLATSLRLKLERGTLDARRHPLPTELTGGALVYLADVELPRARLPGGHLDRSLLFAVAHPDLARASVQLLPHELWWSPDTDPLTRV